MFGVREVLILLHSLQTVLFWQIAVMFALFAYVCLFNDSNLSHENDKVFAFVYTNLSHEFFLSFVWMIRF